MSIVLMIYSAYDIIDSNFENVAPKTNFCNFVIIKLLYRK